MSRFFSYINSSKKILGTYDGLQPFSFHIKKQFAANKSFGSKDRRTIAEICYAWCRTSHLFGRNLQDENLVKALFLCVNAGHPLLLAMNTSFNDAAHLPAGEKLAMLHLQAADIFPFKAALGNIDATAFPLSFLRQPLLFLRLRPGKEKQVTDKLEQQGIAYSRVSADCIAVANATRLEALIQFNKEAVIQDKNSQHVFNFLNSPADATHLPPWLAAALTSREKITVWDCCAASGGKSILLYDRLKGHIKLTVSDIRPAILHNCKKRLQQAGININHAFVADVSQSIAGNIDKDFDIIICDAPCTGSGTWSRTPEQLAYFAPEKIAVFAALQKKIAVNASAYLNNNGLFIYITCSVFKEENEELVKAVQQQTGLQLLHSQYLEGYNEQADTMFVAVFKK